MRGVLLSLGIITYKSLTGDYSCRKFAFQLLQL